jgi:hypothetical protein
MKANLISRPVAKQLFEFYNRRVGSPEFLESSVVLLYEDASGDKSLSSRIDFIELRKTWNEIRCVPLFLNLDSGEVSDLIPGDLDACPDDRFVRLDEETQLRTLFGKSAIFLR